MTGKKRDRLQIIHDILKVISNKNGCRPTHILYKSNLSHKMLSEYLSELMEKKFISSKVDKKGKVTYYIEDKGYKYLQDYNMIRAFTESYGLD